MARIRQVDLPVFFVKDEPDLTCNLPRLKTTLLHNISLAGAKCHSFLCKFNLLHDFKFMQGLSKENNCTRDIYSENLWNVNNKSNDLDFVASDYMGKPQASGGRGAGGSLFPVLLRFDPFSQSLIFYLLNFFVNIWGLPPWRLACTAQFVLKEQKLLLFSSWWRKFFKGLLLF